MVLIVSIALSYTYTMAKHQYLRKRVMHAFALWPYIDVEEPAQFRKFLQVLAIFLYTYEKSIEHYLHFYIKLYYITKPNH